MKKLLVLMLVLGMASLTNATIMDVVTVGTGDAGHAGTSVDPLDIGETIEIKIVLNADPNPTWYYGGGYAGQNGYWLSSMDMKLSADVGTLAEKGTGAATKMKHNAALSPWGEDEPAITSNVVTKMMGVVTGDGLQATADLVWNLKITADGLSNQINLDLILNGTSDYSEGPMSWGVPGVVWISMTESDLGDLVVHQVPEPATIALLGLGGMLLLRRRR